MAPHRVRNALLWIDRAYSGSHQNACMASLSSDHTSSPSWSAMMHFQPPATVASTRSIRASMADTVAWAEGAARRTCCPGLRPGGSASRPRPATGAERQAAFRARHGDGYRAKNAARMRASRAKQRSAHLRAAERRERTELPVVS
jgi:hypothetical protein